MNETILAIALIRLLQRCNGHLDQNFYTIPEVKAAYRALAQFTHYSGDWHDINLDEILSRLESRL